ncbi:MAG: DNA cytosine methyltransferase, partial [Streptosporangiaceae bacterium]
MLTALQKPPDKRPLRAAEFFAGIGLVRLGLEAVGIQVIWSNEIDPDKHAMYMGQFPAGSGQGQHHFQLGDVAHVAGSDVPDVELAWAS